MNLIEQSAVDQGLAFIGELGSILDLSQGETAVLILLIAISLGILVAILTGALIPVMAIARFTYPITYVRATGTPFIEEENLFPLAEAGTVDAALDTLHRHGVDLGEGEGVDVSRLREQLQAWTQKEFLILQGSVPSGIQPFFEALGMAAEIEVLKDLIIRKHRGMDPEAIGRAVVPVGRLHEERVTRIANAAGIAELIELLDGTPYREPLEEAVPRYLNDRQVLPFVAALDLFFYRELTLSILRSDSTLSEPLQAYIGTRIDLANVATVLSGKAAGLCRERVTEYLLPGGRALDVPLLTHMAEAQSVLETLALLDRTPYGTLLAPVIPAFETAQEIPPILAALDRYLLEYAAFLGQTYPLGAGPLLEFLIGLEYEARNIHIVLTGISRGVSPERMKRLAVTRGRTA